MTQILSKLQNFPLDKKKIIAILAFVAVLVFLDVSFIIKAQIKSIKNVSGKVANLKKKIDTLNNELALMKQVQVERKLKVPPKVKKIISGSDLPALIQDIDALAKKNNVRVTQIKPGWSMGDQKIAVGNFSPVSILLEMNCNYHQFGSFINDLENAQNFIAVEQMEIVPLGNDCFQQKIKLLLRTYVKK